MNDRFATSSRCFHRRGSRRRRSIRAMTLIEVLAGLALLAALLAGIVSVKARATRQWVRADQRLRAIAAADALLGTWWQDPRTFPRAGAGVAPGGGQWRWQTRVVANPNVEALGAQDVRLQVS